MRQRSNNALTYQKVVHSELRKQEENPDDPVAHAHIKVYSKKAEKELEPLPHKIVAGECLPDLSEGAEMDVWSPTITLTHPNSIHLTASLDRLILAEATGYQEMCIDAADTIAAENSLEKMLAHQMALCHAQGMNLVVKAGKTRDENISLKMLYTATRFMDIYQKGFDAIHRAKRGNRQTVVVKYQQVNVTDGGQAVIANSTGGRSIRRGDV
ncbi:MAG: hypothetical protein PHF56_20270 [Desulfuromonadaceae bacterium]|nr:hypothetical protein [Desulfuromonadaceae bacterium]